MEAAPDSSPLRVNPNTHLESGIPPARMREERTPRLAPEHELTLDTGLERLELALAGVTRSEVSLALLSRGLKHLASSAALAREANTELIHELDALRTHLARTHDEEQALRFRMHQLEQLLDVIRHETSRERAFLIEQQDLFLTEIMNDHDRQVGELERMIREGASQRADSAELAELTAQRDQAREYATRCERERDLAWHELAHGAAPGPDSTPPVTLRRPPSSPTAAEVVSDASDASSKPGATAIASVALRAIQVPARSASSPGESARSATGYSRPGSGEDSDE